MSSFNRLTLLWLCVIASAASAADLEKDIVFKMDFDDDVQIRDEYVEFQLPLDGFCQGKFGKAYHFERQAKNLLPISIASLSGIDNAFEGIDGAKVSLNQDKDKDKDNDNILTVEGRGINLMPIKLQGLRTPKKSYTISPLYQLTCGITGSCFIKGMKGTEITTKMFLSPWSASDKERKAILNKYENLSYVKYDYKTSFFADFCPELTISMTGEWQRIAAYAEIDARSADGRVIGFGIASASPVKIMLKQFQYEQTRCAPSTSFAPTSYLQKNTYRPSDAGGAKFENVQTLNFFPVACGTISFWAKIPMETNIQPEPGCFFEYAIDERQPHWSIRYNRIVTGTGEEIRPKTNLPMGQWFQIAVTWNEQEMIYYVNGKKTASAGRNFRAISGIDKYTLSVGKSLMVNDSCNALMDELIIFNRSLNVDEVSELCNRSVPFEATSDFRLAPFTGKYFFRNDDGARLLLKVYSKTNRKMHLVWNADGFPAQSEAFNLRKGWNDISAKFQPALFLPGKRDLHFSFFDQSGKIILEKTSQIEIKKQIRRDLVKFLAWGGFGEEPLEYLAQLGINAVNVTAIRNLDEISDNGFLINYYLRNTKDLEANNFNVKMTAALKLPDLHILKNYFNWYGTLLNSEMFDNWEPKDWDKYPWLLQQATKALGFVPPYEKVSTVPPCQIIPDDVTFDQYGIYNAPGKSYETFWWFVNKGQMTIQLNTENAKLIKSIAPENITWTEPPASSGMFSNVDMAAAWGYTLGESEILAQFRKDFAYARNAKKLFQPTVGASYYVNRELKANVNGKQISLALTVDELTANTWLSLAAFPAHDVGFWNIFAWYDAENKGGRFWNPGNLSKPFGQIVKAQLYPAAVLLRDMPLAQADVALLLPESTAFYMENNWNYWRLNVLWGRCLAENQINYDVLYDENITPDSLKRYKVVIFPMSGKVSNRVHDALMNVSDSVSIIVDKYCLCNYPNMKMVDHKYAGGYNSDQFKPCANFVHQLYKDLASSVSVRAEGEKGPVMVFERIYGTGRYIIVLNNLWTTGELNKSAVEQEIRGVKYQPYGVPQKAKVTFKSSGDAVIYDFLDSRRINSEQSGEEAQFETDLTPGGAKVFCIYPHAFKEIKVFQDGGAASGKTVNFDINVYDTANSAPGGRQLLDIEVIDADGNKTDESGLYAMENGALRLTVRIALNSPVGKWTLNMQERSSGIKKRLEFTVVHTLD